MKLWFIFTSSVVLFGSLNCMIAVCDFFCMYDVSMLSAPRRSIERQNEPGAFSETALSAAMTPGLEAAGRVNGYLN